MSIWYIAAMGKVTIERSRPEIIAGTADVVLVFWYGIGAGT